jgi:hypothetical protein
VNDLAEAARRAAAAAVERIAGYAAGGEPWPCGTVGGETPALMTGVAGAIDLLVRAARPRYPSMLLPVPGAAWRQRSAGAFYACCGGQSRPGVMRWDRWSAGCDVSSTRSRPG